MPLDPKSREHSSNELEEQERRAVVCRRCGASVAREEDRIEIGDSSLHTFVNPHGMVFRVTCFADAHGCVETGAPTLHYSWFPGCAWQVALCRACQTHLGWRFSGDDEFWGLIDDRVGSGPG